jgi:hypothetical protein
MSSVVVSRDELYRMVWEIPMVRLAAQYGISGNGLAKICDRLNIPYPPRGYWARKAAGQNVVTYRLPPATKGIPADARITASAPRTEPSSPAQEITERLAEMHRKSGVTDSATFRRHHPVIAGWISQHDERVKAHRASRNPYSIKPEPFTEIDRRRHRFLSALFFLLEKAKGRIEDRDLGNVACFMSDEPILVQVREKSRQVRLPPPAGLKPGASYYPRTELRPTGMLVFTIKTRIPGGMKHEWVETEGEPLLERLADIAAVLVAAGPLLAEERRVREEQERLRQIEERRRHEEQQRRKADRNRWRRFLELAERHREAERARTLLSSLMKSEFDPERIVEGRSMGEWIQWTRDWIDRHDAANRSPAAVFSELASITAWTYHDTR